MATVGDFVRSAREAKAQRGEVRIRAGQDAEQGSQVVVAGTSRWGRFVRKTGWRTDLHMSVTRDFGRAVRSEYGERFFRTLPSRLKAELDTGKIGRAHV